MIRTMKNETDKKTQMMNNKRNCGARVEYNPHNWQWYDG